MQELMSKAFPMAAFEVTLYGRFCVTPEGLRKNRRGALGANSSEAVNAHNLAGRDARALHLH